MISSPQNMTTETQATLRVPCPNAHEDTPFTPTLSVGDLFNLRQNKGTSPIYCSIHSWQLVPHKKKPGNYSWQARIKLSSASATTSQKKVTTTPRIETQYYSETEEIEDEANHHHELPVVSYTTPYEEVLALYLKYSHLHLKCMVMVPT